jgi:hypothetical protein
MVNVALEKLTQKSLDCRREIVIYTVRHFTSNGIPVFREISNKSSTTGLINGIPSLLRIASASLLGSPGIDSLQQGLGAFPQRRDLKLTQK